MGKTPYSIIKVIALLDDPSFVEWAAHIGYAPKPEPDAESMANFRTRVIHGLDRLSARSRKCLMLNSDIDSYHG